MGRIIRNGVEYGNGSTFSVVYLTQEEYDALPESKLTDGIEYRITDNNPTTPSAKSMAYDGTASGIEANNVQDAIDALTIKGLENIATTEPIPFGVGVSDSAYKIVIEKVGKLCIMNVMLKISALPSSAINNYAIGKIENQEFLPNKAIMTDAQFNMGGYPKGIAILVVNTDGTITCIPPQTGVTYETNMTVRGQAYWFI